MLESAVQLLETLIVTPSFSKEEAGTADLIGDFLAENGRAFQRLGNNIWANHPGNQPGRPTVLLNSHHDTVKPVAGWQRPPFEAILEQDKLYGLGSNDAGGPLVSLLATFVEACKTQWPFNLVMAATAEEEISGKGGIEMLLPHLGKIDLGIVGEPTQMHLAVAEKGLMVLDITLAGKAGHAAREEGINAIYEALPALNWFRDFRFSETSQWLGPVKMSVTQIAAGSQHNVVPDRCTLVVDVRPNDCYSLAEILETIRENVKGEVVPRSVRLQPSHIRMDHPAVKAGISLNLPMYGSPTLSDQALMPFPTVKIGPGDSARSHTADEYIHVTEIAAGIDGYRAFLQALATQSGW